MLPPEPDLRAWLEQTGSSLQNEKVQNCAPLEMLVSATLGIAHLQPEFQPKGWASCDFP